MFGFSRDMGIDLGTANTLLYLKGQGIILNEPSVVAIRTDTKQIEAVGEGAKMMIGRTPGNIVAIRPMRDGVIADFETTATMLRYFIKKANEKQSIFSRKPRVMICVPSGITAVEKRAVEDATIQAGAREAYTIEEPMAAAIGAGLPVHEPTGSMVVDIGGGTTEVAIISLGGIVVARSLRIAGDKLNEDIIKFSQEEYKLLIGERTAEEVKITIGSAYPLKEKQEMPIRGRNLITGLPEEIIITDKDVRKALDKSIKEIVKAIKMTVEDTPPELLADVMSKGIYLLGGGSLLKGLDRLIAEETKIKTKIADDPLTAVARGAGFVLEHIDELHEVLVETDTLEAPKY